MPIDQSCHAAGRPEAEQHAGLSIVSPAPTAPSGTPASLARCVGDVDEFAAHWGRSPLVRRDDAGFADLLDVDEVEQLLVDLARVPEFRLIRDGTAVPRDAYTTTVRIGGRDTPGVADIERVLEHVAAGASIVLQSLQRSWPPLARFCSDIEAGVSHPVQANAYLTPRGSAALAPHTDTHDVIVLQVDGTKRWEVAGLGDVVLTPGDSMYLPAGTRHSALTAATMSLHITIGILSATRRDVVRRIIDAAADAELDRPLPLGYAAPGALAELTAEIESALGLAAAALGRVDRHRVARDLERRHRHGQARRQRRLGRLVATIDPDALRPSTIVRRRPGATIVLRERDEALLVELADRQLRVPLFVAAAMRHIVEHEQFRLDEIPGLDDADRAVLVRRLVREGALQTVPVDGR